MENFQNETVGGDAYLSSHEAAKHSTIHLRDGDFNPFLPLT